MTPMWKYLLGGAALITLLLWGKKASAATLTDNSLPASPTGTRRPEVSARLGATGTRLCCGTAAPVSVASPIFKSTAPPTAPVSNIINRGAILSTAPPMLPVSQLRVAAPVLATITAPTAPTQVQPRFFSWQSGTGKALIL